MKQRKLSWLVGAVAAVSIAGLSTPSYGQGRVDRAHALDANNRVGSGGSNGIGQSRVGNTASPNDIVYGNVTGGRQFRGQLGSTDLNSFHGFTAGSEVSAFTRQSSGTPTGPLAVNNAQSVSRYYDPTAKGVNAPAGYVQQNYGSTGYVPAPPTARGFGDLRIGAVQYDNTIAAPRPGETMLPGIVDSSNTNSLITASPLYGVRQWGNNDDPALLNNSSFRSLNDASLDDQTLQQFRAELEVPTTPTGGNLAARSRVGEGTLDSSVGQTTPNLAQPEPAPLGQPTNEPLPSGQLPGENLGAGNLGGGIVTNQKSQQRLLSSAADQSSTYKLMEDQYKSFLGDQGYAAKQANKKYNTDVANLRAQEQSDRQKKSSQLTAPAVSKGPGAAAPGGAGPGAPDAAPNVEKAPINVPGPSLQAPQEKPAPVKVDSLATGIKAAGLKQLMTQAETQMSQGKWISAIETYQNAARVAPNNPLVLLGRANAELGATYYARAEDDLKLAFTQDKPLLMAQFDLRKMIGNDRLEFLVGELKEMTKDQKQTRPLLLLAYIAYNTGHEQQAVGYLDMLDQRAKDDSLVKTLRDYWQLPGQKSAAPAKPELNK